MAYFFSLIDTDVGVSASGDLPLPESNFFVWTSLGAVTATSTNLGQNIFGHVSFRIKEVSGKDSNGNDFTEIVDECAWVLVNGTFISWECLCDDAAAAGSFNLINIGSDV
jgi:hypothetical protein